MEDNTQAMLQLATFLANKPSENQDLNKSLATQLAQQVLLNTNKNSQQQTNGQQQHLTSPQKQLQHQKNKNQQGVSSRKLPMLLPSNSNQIPTNIQNPFRSGRPLLPKQIRLNNSNASDKIYGFAGNTNRLGLNTNNPRVLHALRLLKKRVKQKRGPKEKETFQRYFYCLPDKYSKLPKFSSTDPSEKGIVRQHQEAGFGYPPNDYNDGYPNKTPICLSYSAEKFHHFIVSMYPKIEDKLYDMYKIDKQRRLIRIDMKTPRAIKDMKYQGSLIIIPYDDENDRPPQILYRSGEDFFIQVPPGTSPPFDHNAILSNQAGLNIRPLSPDSSEMPMSSDQSYNEGHKSEETEMPIHPSAVKTEPEEVTFESTSLPSVGTDGGQSETEETATQEMTDFTHEKCKILAIARTLRGCLKGKKLVNVNKATITSDVLHLYRTNPSLVTCQLLVRYNDNSMNEDTQYNNHEPCLSMFVYFWDAVLKQYFIGDQEVVPLVNFEVEDDFYFILGKILYHGLALCDYWPVKISQATVSTILMNKCSERQLMTSLHHVMSETERSVIAKAKKESKEGRLDFSPTVLRNVCTVMRNYGCKQKPNISLLDNMLLRSASCYLVREPYWQLMQMRQGMNTAEGDVFKYVNEGDIFTLYSQLTPNALSLFEKVKYMYMYSTIESNLEMEEKRVKMNFESFITKLNTETLGRFLFKWCNTDCLCVDSLFVRFNPDTVSQIPVFIPEQATIVLSSMYVSKEELHQFLSDHC